MSVHVQRLLLHSDAEKTTTELDFSLENTLEVRSLDRFHAACPDHTGVAAECAE